MEPLVPILFEGQQFYSHTHTHIIIMLYTLNLYNAVAAAKSLQSCPTLCDSIGGSLPGSPVPGILQARVLELLCTKLQIHESPAKRTTAELSAG